MSRKKRNLTPAELKAIEDHKFFLSQQRGYEVSIEESIEDFLATYLAIWNRSKASRDMSDQRSEIDKYKWIRSEQEKRDVGCHVAARDWIEQFAAIWRAERESLEKNGFQRMVTVVKDPHGLHFRPTSEIALLATKYDCDVYVHKAGMPYANFLLEGKPFMNVKSLLGMLSIEVICGDTLEFIALGAQAMEALDAIARAIEVHAPPPPYMTHGLVSDGGRT
ncbi:MAG: hypothetical protein C0404_06335 [Verrucomicrobia bacterium]|nr:hypothetical protein [Verrucomicrobiota bacterium]